MRVLQRIAPVLHLTRVTTAFAAVANVWFVILWTRGRTEQAGPEALFDKPLPVLLFGGAAMAVGLYAHAACLNDFLDFHRDRALNPQRPLASGAASPETAIFAVAITLLIAVLGSTVFGTETVVITLGLAAAILLFNAAGKFVPGIGMVLLSIIYAGHMLAPNPQLKFLAPVWLVMTHAMVVAAVTHRLGRKSPPVTRRALAFAILGWALVSLTMLIVGRRRLGGELWPKGIPPEAITWPILTVATYVGVAFRRVRSLGPGPRAAEKLGRYGALWLSLYAVAWMVGAGLLQEAAILGALAFTGFVGMTALREAYGLAEHPLGYRR